MYDSTYTQVKSIIKCFFFFGNAIVVNKLFFSVGNNIRSYLSYFLMAVIYQCNKLLLKVA